MQTYSDKTQRQVNDGCDCKDQHVAIETKALLIESAALQGFADGGRIEEL